MKLTKSTLKKIFQEEFNKLIPVREEQVKRGGPRVNKVIEILSLRGCGPGIFGDEGECQKKLAQGIIQAALKHPGKLQNFINTVVAEVSVRPDEQTRMAAAIAMTKKLKELASI